MSESNIESNKSLSKGEGEWNTQESIEKQVAIGADI